VQSLPAAATCLATVLYATDVHKSTLADGDGAACDVLLEGCVKMLANHSNTAASSSSFSSSSATMASKSTAFGVLPKSGGGENPVLEAAVGILASLCIESDTLAARLSVRLAIAGARQTALQQLALIADDAKDVKTSNSNGGSNYDAASSSSSSSGSGGAALSSIVSNALVVLSSLLVAQGASSDSLGSAARPKLELLPDEVGTRTLS